MEIMGIIFFVSLFWIASWVLSKVWDNSSIVAIEEREDITTRYAASPNDDEQTANWKEAIELIECYVDGVCDINPDVIEVMMAHGYVITKQDTYLRKHNKDNNGL